jgi:hypothetical protein
LRMMRCRMMMLRMMRRMRLRIMMWRRMRIRMTMRISVAQARTKRAPNFWGAAFFLRICA